MNKNIIPVYSTKTKKNIYDYYDTEKRTTTKVAGFNIDVYDPMRGTRIRKRYKADYRTVELIVEGIKRAIHNNEPKVVDKLSGVKARTLDDLYRAFCNNKLRLANRVGNGISEQTLKRYLVALKSMVKTESECIAQLNISRITTDWIENRLQRRLKNGLSMRTLNTDITHLKAIFKWGVENRYFDNNPFDNIPKFKVNRKMPRILSTDEWNSIWSITKFSRWRPLILTYLLTGARVSEILKPKLTWGNINFTKNNITLPKRKRGRKLTLPMSNILKNELIRLRKYPLLKETSSGADDEFYPFPFHKDYISHVVKKELFIPAGVKDISIHDLRRTFGSYLIHLGIPITVVSQLMSHSTTAITEQVYIGQLDGIQRKALDDLADYLIPDEDKSQNLATKNVVID